MEDIPLSYARDLNPCDGIIRRPPTKDSSNPVVMHMSEIPCVLVEVLISRNKRGVLADHFVKEDVQKGTKGEEEIQPNTDKHTHTHTDVGFLSALAGRVK